MKVTRVIFEDIKSQGKKPLALCSVVLDDSLKLTNIRLYHGSKGYYLVLPSKQDVYKDIILLNPELSIIIPNDGIQEGKTQKNKYDEFFHPVDSSLYREILNTVLAGYELFKAENIRSYRPEKAKHEDKEQG